MNKNESFKVGDVLVSSWGWEQTNVQFYQVVALVGKCSVALRELDQEKVETGFMSGTTKPIPDQFISDNIEKKRVSSHGYIKFESYKFANKADMSRSYHWSSYE
jgi:hypothetical protein